MEINKNAVIVSLLLALGGILLAFADAFYFMTESKIWIGIGCSLLASSLVILLNALLVDRVRADPLREWGIEKAYDSRQAKNADADPSLEHAHFRVDGVAFGLSAFRSKNCERVESAMARGVNFRFLVMDPDSPYASQRDKEEGNKTGHIAKTIHGLVDWANELNKKGFRGKIEVRGYQCMTLDFYWRIDDDIYIGPYWYNRPSSGTITYKFTPSGRCAKLYAEYFEQLWHAPGMRTLTDNL